MIAKEYLIIEDKAIKIESVSVMSYEPATRSWNNVTITIKEFITDDFLADRNLYILKGENLFFIKVGSFSIDGKTILVKPKWCTLLNL
ncbi:MAG: hypothetical protein JNK69_03510 [Saprospiraceae bacterium]|nr:hypothetical protein [Saprospiraceae bacterium]